jgi:S1-C subfamily serine protease
VALCARLAPAVGAFFQRATVGRGGGSGVVIDPRGYAITNFHVSLTEHDLLVGLNDGHLYKARLLGIDPGGDIALAKLEGKERFAFAEMGRSDEVRIGDRVLAMGNPFLLATDFQPTVTEGVVSGVHRFRDAAGGTELVYGDCIQIDASINPGNSGGPLFDEAGRWIGINGLGGFRDDRGRVNVGVGYAASVDQIKNFLEDLRSGQQCEHGTMNATVRDLPDDDDPHRTLVKVDAIVQDSVAWQAGLRAGDVLVSFDGVPVRTQNQFLTLISRLPAGRRVRLVVDRRRDDATIGGANNYIRSTTGFRLAGVPSGPAEGKWQPDEELVEAETKATIAAARATTASRLFPSKKDGWSAAVTLEGVRHTPGQPDVRFRELRKGGKIRLELGPEGQARVLASNGAVAWQRSPSGEVDDLPRAQADVLEGTSLALDAFVREGGESELSELKFTGGETLDQVRCSRLEVRDKKGRRERLYFDVATGLLAGVAFRDEKGRWVEERWVFAAKPPFADTPAGHSIAFHSFPSRFVRVDDQTGDPLGEDEITATSYAALDDALFERGAK